MQLIKLHKILIGSTIALGAVLLAVGVLQLVRTGEPQHAVTGLLGLVGGLGFAAYLRWFLARQRARSAARGNP